jgi:hypothetical protein
LPVTIGTLVSQCAEVISTPFGRGSVFAIARHAAPASPGSTARIGEPCDRKSVGRAAWSVIAR